MQKARLLTPLLLMAVLASCQQTTTPDAQTSTQPDQTLQVDTTENTSGEGAEVVVPDPSYNAQTDGGTLSAQALNAWPTLKQGSNGADVKALQYLLNARGASLTVDGDFGPATLSAVKSFQSRSGLTADGVVGAQTWGKVIMTVQQGSTGNAVKAVQSYLGVTVDGQFGPGTASAVKSFQSRTGLSADGVVGAQTWQALVAGTNTVTPPTSDRAKLAQQILNSSRITLSHSSSTVNGSPYQTMLDTSRGLQATSGCHGSANCGAKVYLDTRMLTGVLKVANSYRLYINSTTGSGEHAATSYHYRGRAIDVSSINGVGVSSSNPYYKGLMAACRATGAVEVLGPGNAGHSTHVHCAW